MSDLSELYKIKAGLKNLGLSLSEDQEKQLNELEENLIKKDILPVITETIEPALKEVKRELVLVADYKPGQPISVSLSRKTNISKIINAKPLQTDPSKEQKPEPQKPLSPKASTSKLRSYANANEVMKDFVTYMRQHKHSESTISGYTNALQVHVTPFLHKYCDENAENIFAIAEHLEVRKVLDKLESSWAFKARDLEMHREMSCAIKKYLSFVMSKKYPEYF